MKTTQPNDPVYASNCSGHGLTKREYFAAMAMQGAATIKNELGITPALVARWSVQLADALIAELNKENVDE